MASGTRSALPKVSSSRRTDRAPARWFRRARSGSGMGPDGAVQVATDLGPPVRCDPSSDPSRVR